MAEGKNQGMSWPVALGIVVVLAAGVWYLTSTQGGPSGGGEPTKTVASVSTPVPERAIFRVSAEGGKFNPSRFTVEKGRTLVVELTAVDGKYDFGFEDQRIGFNVVVGPGQTQAFGFETKDYPAGNYAFRCMQFCPQGAMIGVLSITE